MTDKSSEIITLALRQAAVEPAGLPLHGGRSQSLFTGSSSGKKAAQVCKSEGYLQIIRTESRGRSAREICAITEKGLAYLLSQVSPKQVLEDLVRALHSQQAQVGDLLATARHWQANIDACKILVQKALSKENECAWGNGSGTPNGAAHDSVDLAASPHFALASFGESLNPASAQCKQNPPITDPNEHLRQAILTQLHHSRESGAAGDCPLPELFRRLHQNLLTIGRFHDQLRTLHEQERIYLHPWSGPLFEIPEPAFALLVGHGIAYYASIR